MFPLPNVVLFPKTLLPLHIFETRYRIMTRETLDGDGRMVIALVRGGWEPRYSDQPPVYEIACIGQIASHEELDEGKYNIILAGLHRVRVVCEVEHSPYRMAEVEKLEERGYDEKQDDIIRRRNHIGALFTRYTELAMRNVERATELVSQLSFEALVNLAASSLNLPAEEKQALLEMDEITHRCDELIPVLQRQLEAMILVRHYEHLKPDNPSQN